MDDLEERVRALELDVVRLKSTVEVNKIEQNSLITSVAFHVNSMTLISASIALSLNNGDDQKATDLVSQLVDETQQLRTLVIKEELQDGEHE